MPEKDSDCLKTKKNEAKKKAQRARANLLPITPPRTEEEFTGEERSIDLEEKEGKKKFLRPMGRSQGVAIHEIHSRKSLERNKETI